MCTDQELHSLRVYISRVYCTKSQFRTYQTPTMDKYHNWSFWRWIIVNIPWNINIENQTIFLTNDCWPNFSIKLTNSLDSVLSQAVLIIICIVVWPFVKAEKIHKNDNYFHSKRQLIRWASQFHRKNWPVASSCGHTTLDSLLTSMVVPESS